MQKIVLCLALIYTSIIHGADVSLLCGDDTWTVYKDEKCFKLFQTFETRDAAEGVCNGQGSTLATIKSDVEQTFLTDYVYKTSDSFRIWLGASRRLENNTEFEWNDRSNVQRWFTNWAVDRPSDVVARTCVNMVPSILLGELSEMEWFDTICTTQNWFVCQKLQTWPLDRLQPLILAERAERQRSDRIFTRQLQVLQDNPIPIGFIYVQLPNQPEPKNIWQTVQWVEITSEYAGLFFRVLGGDSGGFGAIQEAHSPRLSLVQAVTVSAAVTAIVVTANNVWSTGISSGTTPSGSHRALQFLQSSGEVRPRNQAVRIWRRAS